MISYQQAQQIVIQQARSFGQEKIGLDQAYGRVLAETIRADRDYPPFHRASMDGYAIRYQDWEKGTRQFDVVEVIYAGATATRAIKEGECYKIMTGAPVPPGVDVVIRKEDTNESSSARLTPSGQPSDGDTTNAPYHRVTIKLSSCRPFMNIARQGEDMQTGDVAIGVPSVIGPDVMGILASLGKSECLVEKLPRVALFTTGDEVVQVGYPVSHAQIRNSNRWILTSLLKGWGISPFLYEHLPDSKAALRGSLTKAIGGTGNVSATRSLENPLRDISSPGEIRPADIIMLSGGVSAGDADYVPGILAELGVQRLFHKIAIKPGKPIWCGRTPGGSMVFALPGNPFSGMVGFTLLVQPYLHACFGLAAPALMGLPLEEGRKKKTPLDEFFPVRFNGSPAKLSAIDINGSGDSRLGLYANALALHPAGSGDLEKGTNTEYYSLFRS